MLWNTQCSRGRPSCSPIHLTCTRTQTMCPSRCCLRNSNWSTERVRTTSLTRAATISESSQ